MTPGDRRRARMAMLDPRWQVIRDEAPYVVRFDSGEEARRYAETEGGYVMPPIPELHPRNYR